MISAKHRATADVCDELGTAVGVLHSLELAFGAKPVFSGPACPVRLMGPDGALAALLKTNGAGRVAVVEVASGSATPAVFGEGMAANAEANGWAGVVIAGAVRDVATFADRKVGIRARGVCPSIQRGASDGGEVASVEIDGVTITTGHTIIADLDGVIVVPTDTL